MIAADLIRRTADAGVSMIHSDGALQLHGERQPSTELLADLIAHKIEIIAALNAANDPIPWSAWLCHVARLHDTRPDVLLKEGHLEQHDLVELDGTEPALVAGMIRTSPAWITRPHRAEQSPEVHATKEYEPQYTILTAATASPAWREADVVHTNHLMRCRACHAAIGRYCAAGVDLRQRYNNTPMEESE